MDICFCDIRPPAFHSIEGVCIKCGKRVDHKIQTLLRVARAADALRECKVHDMVDFWRKVKVLFEALKEVEHLL